MIHDGVPLSEISLPLWVIMLPIFFGVVSFIIATIIDRWEIERNILSSIGITLLGFMLFLLPFMSLIDIEVADHKQEYLNSLPFIELDLVSVEISKDALAGSDKQGNEALVTLVYRHNNTLNYYNGHAEIHILEGTEIKAEAQMLDEDIYDIKKGVQKVRLFVNHDFFED